MTIDEAIKELKDEALSPRYTYATKRSDAFQLGIEALKRVKLLRTSAFYPHNKLLYGETEE